MRIGLVLPNLPGYSETFFRSKINGLQGNGHKVALFVGHQREAFQNPPCEVRLAYLVDSRIPLFQLFRMVFVLAALLLRASGTVRRFWALEKADGASSRKVIERLYINAHILTQKLDWLHFGFATMTLGRENVAKAIGAKMAVSFRGYDVCIYPVKNGFDCYRHVWGKVDKVHVISDGLMEVAQTKLGLSDKVSVQKITPAIDVERFRRETRAGSLHSPVRLVTVGRLHWVKGLDYSIEACARLKAGGLDFQYTIVGEGQAFEHLRFMVHLLKLEDCVFFVGRKSPDEVAKVMEESDIYLQPSVSEGFCNAVLEAQAAGLLCIVSDAEGLPENVIDGETGWVVPKRDSGALTDKCLHVVGTGNEVQQQIRKNAVARGQKEFNLEKHINSWMSFYK